MNKLVQGLNGKSKSSSSTNNNNNSFLHSYYFGENGDSTSAPQSLHAGTSSTHSTTSYTTTPPPLPVKSHTLGRSNSRHQRRETVIPNNGSTSFSNSSSNSSNNVITNNNNSSLHSYKSDQLQNNKKSSISKPARTTSNRNYELMKTKSDDSIVERPSHASSTNSLYRTQGPGPGKLQKTKSSTFISPQQQSESMFYKSKVTLTLRRSRQNLNEDFDGTSSPTSLNGPKQTYYYGEGLPPTSALEKPPLPSCLPTERILRRAEELRSQCPTPPPLLSKPALQKTVRCHFIF